MAILQLIAEKEKSLCFDFLEEKIREESRKLIESIYADEVNQFLEKMASISNFNPQHLTISRSKAIFTISLWSKKSLKNDLKIKPIPFSENPSRNRAYSFKQKSPDTAGLVLTVHRIITACYSIVPLLFE